MTGVSILIGLAFLAAFNEFVIEFLFGQWKGADGKSKLSKFLPYIAAAVGLAECLVFKLNAMPLVGLENAIAGQVITGIIVGAGSNAVHKFFGNGIRS